jgi:hypothetical protein
MLTGDYGKFIFVCQARNNHMMLWFGFFLIVIDKVIFAKSLTCILNWQFTLEIRFLLDCRFFFCHRLDF